MTNEMEKKVEALLQNEDEINTIFVGEPDQILANFAARGIEMSKFGIVGGAELGYQAAEQVDLTAGVLVAMQGAKTGEEILIKDASTTLTYLNVPVLVNYYIVPGLAIKAGVQPGFLLSQKTKVNFTDGTSEENTSTDHTKKFDLSIPLGLSYEFSDFVIDARYNLGVTKVNDDNSDMSSKNSVIMLTVGYKIPF